MRMTGKAGMTRKAGVTRKGQKYITFLKEISDLGNP
jgi:hypothetical protein